MNSLSKILNVGRHWEALIFDSNLVAVESMCCEWWKLYNNLTECVVMCVCVCIIVCIKCRSNFYTVAGLLFFRIIIVKLNRQMSFYSSSFFFFAVSTLSNAIRIIFRLIKMHKWKMIHEGTKKNKTIKKKKSESNRR